MTRRFEVRPAHCDTGVTLYRVVDVRDGRWVATYTQEVLARNVAFSWERDHLAEATRRAEAGTW